MVWARTKITVQDDLLRPRPMSKINFTGKNPDRFYTETPRLLITNFKVTEHEIQEKKFQWHKGDPEKFSVSWEVYKELDKFSLYVININLNGSKSKGIGSAKITVDGVLRTEYPQDTVWQRSLLYEFLRMFWHTTFYAPRHLRYLTDGRRLLINFITDLKKITQQED